MILNLRNYDSIYLRYKLAEIVACQITKGILTTKYPPEILDTEFFYDLSEEEKRFLQNYWTSFDIFKPIFEIVNEVPYYKGFILYEVKSKLITEKNKGEKNTPTIDITFNQKKFFDECIEKLIPVRIFLVFYLKNWEVEYKEFDVKDIDTHITPPSAWHEEKMRRIRSSKLNQFWHDLFPEYVLYRVNEEELEEKEKDQTSDYINEITGTPLTRNEKEILIEIAKKKNERFPVLIEDTNNDKKKLMNDKRPEQNEKKDKAVNDERLLKIKAKYPNAYELWTEKEENYLSDLFKKEDSIENISNILGRQPGAVISRLVKLGLMGRRI